MDINATIIGQFITFAILIWFTMKYVWPPITKAIHDREKKIASGLEAGERGKLALEQAESKALVLIQEARLKATQLIEQAQVQSAQLIENAKGQAKVEGQRIVEMAQAEIVKEVAKAKETLRGQVAKLAISGAEKIIRQNIDPSIHRELLNGLVAEM